MEKHYMGALAFEGNFLNLRNQSTALSPAAGGSSFIKQCTAGFKKYLAVVCLMGLLMGWGEKGWGQTIFISQYIETSSGSTPKGIEIYNPTGSDIVFSLANTLEVFQGTNGASCILLTSVTSGTLAAGKVWVIGTSDVVTHAINNGTNLSGTTTYSFTYNGDDALQIKLAGATQDVFGTCGTDPGSNWSGSGVSTE